MHPTSTARFLAAFLATALGLSATGASAQPFDHLKCFKVKDSNSFLATVDLHPADDVLLDVDANCTVKVRSRQVCFPVEKNLNSLSGGDPLDVPGQDLANAFLCYVVKCPTTALPASLEMSDQFGTHTLTRLKTSTICAPAVQGVPVTTTTLPPGPVKQCTDATAPACDGTCGSDQVACIEDAGACVCQFQEPFLQCGLISGVPNCHGLCMGSQSCIEVSGACQCAMVYE